MKYKYRKKRGALNEAVTEQNASKTQARGGAQSDGAPSPQQQQTSFSNVGPATLGLQRAELEDITSASAASARDRARSHAATLPRAERRRVSRVERGGEDRHHSEGLDPNAGQRGRQGMLFYTVDEGQRALMTDAQGRVEVLVGPARVWARGRRFRAMQHHVAHPGEFLIVRYRDGGQEHLVGPAEVWMDPRVHLSITREDALQVADREAVVVYSRDPQSGEVVRRIEQGPASFVPEPGEWLHTFSWHGSVGGAGGFRKVPNALVFQKLWQLPDQMYHDVSDVRTADDAVLNVKLMLFFELVDIERMLEATHDPIGDFVNATTSDVVDFVSRHDFVAFKRNTDRLNELETYRQLTARAAQCGYRIDKVVYRGYDAPRALQKMQDQAIESRTRLQLEKETQRQAQDLEDFKLERQIARAQRRREESASDQVHQLELQRSRQRHDLVLAGEQQQAELERGAARRAFEREQRAADVTQQHELDATRRDQIQAHLAALAGLGVDLTAYLTQHRADRVLEVRGASATHLHLPDEDAG